MAPSVLGKDQTTPGVYITELPAFPPSIVGVATAIPVFIGYTEKATDPSSRKSVYNQAVPIGSMNDFVAVFGGGWPAALIVKEQQDMTKSFDFVADAKHYFVCAKDGTDVRPMFNLFVAMQLFYANGGGNCFVISVGNYWGKTGAPAPGEVLANVKSAPLVDALKNVAHDVRGPTMIVVPDACLLKGDDKYSDYAGLAQTMLEEASNLRDRVAILDLPAAVDPPAGSGSTQSGLQTTQNIFSAAIAPSQEGFSYGTAYGPALQTSVLTWEDVDFSNLSGSTEGTKTMATLLKAQANSLYGDDTVKQKLVEAAVGQAFPDNAAAPGSVLGTPYKNLDPAASTDGQKTYYKVLDNFLLNALPLYRQIQQILLAKLNVAPPSGAIAGLWSRNDAEHGVWNAPANMSLAGVVAPLVVLNDKDQSDYNLPLNGEAINIVRAFPGRGAVVWGARTLDGNCLDYRYIQVRRTQIYVEQSIKIALQSYVFAPNDANTWTVVVASISNFLTNLWQAGGLMGTKAEEAFGVQCGLGSTMTGIDVLNGYMIVSLKLQMVHPADFVELTFKQTMQGV